MAKKVGSMWTSYMKGVSPGGEEFIVKLEKSLKKKAHPKFQLGTLKEVMASYD